MKKNKKGFTLVELVIVVAVMAVLIAVAIPTVTSITRTAKETVADTNARTIESTLKLAEANYNKDDNGAVTLDGQQIFNAVYEAKLGITEGEFVYNTGTGVVYANVEGADDYRAATEGEYVIEFDGTSLKVTLKGNGLEGEGAVADEEWEDYDDDYTRVS